MRTMASELRGDSRQVDCQLDWQMKSGQPDTPFLSVWRALHRCSPEGVKVPAPAPQATPSQASCVSDGA